MSSESVDYNIVFIFHRNVNNYACTLISSMSSKYKDTLTDLSFLTATLLLRLENVRQSNDVYMPTNLATVELHILKMTNRILYHN